MLGRELEVPWEEGYVLCPSQEKEKVLATLPTNSEQFYFYSLLSKLNFNGWPLDDQTTKLLEEYQTFISDNRKNSKATSNYAKLLNRMAFLEYDATKDASGPEALKKICKYLQEALNIDYSKVLKETGLINQNIETSENQLTSELEATSYDHHALAQRYQLAFYNQTPNSYEDYSVHWIDNPAELFEYFQLFL